MVQRTETTRQMTNLWTKKRQFLFRIHHSRYLSMAGIVFMRENRREPARSYEQIHKSQSQQPPLRLEF